MEPNDTIRHNGVSSTKRSRISFFGRNLLQWNRDKSKTDSRLDLLKIPLGLTTLFIPDGEVISDLIFVHGLNGDARNTWTKNGQQSLFWPKEWLPKDRGFCDVRIHTFGYASAVLGAAGGVLNVADFARSLLGAIQDAPSIPRESQPPLILVGHSMGGLVIKKACILGHQIPEFQRLVNRIQAIFFLATPHQGANVAVTLSRILSIVSPTRPPFVNDLFPQSAAIQLINDEFPRLCDSLETLQLFSFFETRPMNYGIGKGLIVEKHCAVMNYPRERPTYLDADHRDCARFSSTEDPSYVTVRNALAAAIDAQRRVRAKVGENIAQETQDALLEFLGFPETTDDDILKQDLERLRGSGQWFLETASFQEWRVADSSKLLWLRGSPKTGKSFLAGKVVNSLREQGCDCCSFFFGFSTKPYKSSINSFLRSIAYQMAMIHPEISSTLLDISSQSTITTDGVDPMRVWRQLYLSGGILQRKVVRTQFWVIDALDECEDSSGFLSFLAKAQESWPLRILVTSREPYQPSTTHRMEVVTVNMSDENHNRDISLLIQNNIDAFPATSAEGRQDFVDQISQMSDGSFSWANQLLQGLKQVPTVAQMRGFLASHPSNMSDTYVKMVNFMTTGCIRQDLAKAVLIWITCSIRPLFKNELLTAIQLDTMDKIDNPEKSIMSCCAHLVFVDDRERILIHRKVGDVLLNEDLKSEFAVDNSAGHAILAHACIQCLVDNIQKGAPMVLSEKRSPLLGYASEYLFEHTDHGKPADDRFVRLLLKFLGSTGILDWIEYIAANSNLRKVYEAGKVIAKLVQHRENEHAGEEHVKEDLVTLSLWGRDLQHLVIKFGDRLKAVPSAIHRVITPFCPSDSIIRRQFSSPNRGLSVLGTIDRPSGECLVTIATAMVGTICSMASGVGLFALGTRSGMIIVYDDTIFQEVHRLNHQEPVMLMNFAESGRYLVSSSPSSIRIWDTESWIEVNRFDVGSRPMVLSFIQNDTFLLVASKNMDIVTFDLRTAEETGRRVEGSVELGRLDEPTAGRYPSLASYSPHQHLLAIVYPGYDIIMWDTERHHVQDWYEEDTGSRSNRSPKPDGQRVEVKSLVFSLGVDTHLLAATWADGQLVVYNTCTGKVSAKLPNSNVLHLASSPDGRTLAGSEPTGEIKIYDFASLRYLYRFNMYNNLRRSRMMLFTSDRKRIIDVRGSASAMQCHIWQIPDLPQPDSLTTDTALIPSRPSIMDQQTFVFPAVTACTCVVSPGYGSTRVMVGRDDGSVQLYDDCGNLTNELLFRQTTSDCITQIHVDPLSGLLTCGGYWTVTCRKLLRSPGSSQWTVAEPLVNADFDSRIVQILTSAKHLSLLVSTRAEDILLPLENCDRTSYRAVLNGGQQEPCWFSNPTEPDTLVLVKGNSLEIRSWIDLTLFRTITLQAFDPISRSRSYIISLQHHSYFVTYSGNTTTNGVAKCGLYVWDFDSLLLPNLKPRLSLGSLSDSVKKIIGVHSDRLVYLASDHWVYSLPIDDTALETLPVRHFSFPSDWFPSDGTLHLAVTKSGNILFFTGADLAVIKNGLQTTADGDNSFRLRQTSIAPARLSVRKKHERTTPVTQ